MNNDKRITITAMFKNNNIYNFSVKFSVDGVFDIFFGLTKMPKKDGSGYYWMWPQTVYDQNLATETNYKKGVNKHVFCNKAMGMAVQEACQAHLDKEEGNVSHETNYKKPNNQFGQTEEVNAKDINLEEIKF